METKRETKSQIKMSEDYRKNLNNFQELSNEILLRSQQGELRKDYLDDISRLLMDYCECDTVEIWMLKGEAKFCARASNIPRWSFYYDDYAAMDPGDDTSAFQFEKYRALEQLCLAILRKQFDPSLPFFTPQGSPWTGEAQNSWPIPLMVDGQERIYHIPVGSDFKSIAFIPVSEEDNIGLLLLKSEERNLFNLEKVIFFEGIARILSIALVHRDTRLALRERIKELTCLLQIGQIASNPGASLDSILQDIVELFPPAWLYPEITTGRIRLDDKTFTTKDFREGPCQLNSDLLVNGSHRGLVEVFYTSEKPMLDEGPFLKEERSLIDAIARDVGLITERKKAEEDQEKLRIQLMHADRLATIGQLAAGVVHEINEPLGHILGFAQLTQKVKGLPGQAQKDMKKIVEISLHAREVIKRLMLFGRQVSPSKTHVDLNHLVEEGLGLFAARCAKNNIEVVQDLSSNLPDITADPAQLNQVLVNLIVNGMQAMPDGGKLTIRTLKDVGDVLIIVEDTGVGMSPDIVEQIFVPFFTTKDVNQGTGLGLAVVHGIVQGHKGLVRVESEQGTGTCFEVRLPVLSEQDLEETK
ncbi:sensor histidine kinase [Planctomycetota bacterium]